MILEIECLWHTDATRQKEDAGMTLSIEELEARTMTFYEVSAIAPNLPWEDGVARCTIWTGGDKFVSAYSYEDTKSMIEKARQENL